RAQESAARRPHRSRHAGALAAGHGGSRRALSPCAAPRRKAAITGRAGDLDQGWRPSPLAAGGSGAALRCRRGAGLLARGEQRAQSFTIAGITQADTERPLDAVVPHALVVVIEAARHRRELGLG